MTIADAERFYENDLKKYDVSKNKELLAWLKYMVEKGYHAFIDIDDLQRLIDNIVYWYEMKYPEREMEYYEGTKHLNFGNIDTLSKVMNIKQLLYRLPHHQLCLMSCDYRSNGCGLRDVYNNMGEIVSYKPVLFMRIGRKKQELNSYFGCLSYFLIYADMDSGNVNINYNLNNYVAADNITLDELLILFKEKYADELEFTKLEECIFDHNCDVELRRRILQLVALKLLYSRNTIPERGYERAKRFINEFNKKMDLSLSANEIDEIISRDYTKNPKYENVKKKKKILFKK